MKGGRFFRFAGTPPFVQGWLGNATGKPAQSRRALVQRSCQQLLPSQRQRRRSERCPATTRRRKKVALRRRGKVTDRLPQEEQTSTMETRYLTIHARR